MLNEICVYTTTTTTITVVIVNVLLVFCYHVYVMKIMKGDSISADKGVHIFYVAAYLLQWMCEIVRGLCCELVESLVCVKRSKAKNGAVHFLC